MIRSFLIAAVIGLCTATGVFAAPPAKKTCDCCPYGCGCVPGKKESRCKCYPCMCDPKPSKKTAITDLDDLVNVTSTTFAHDGGKTMFLRAEGHVQTPVKKVTLVIDASDRKLYINGKQVADAQLEEWSSRTVNIKADFCEEGIYFSGGQPAYGQSAYAPVISPSGGCSNGTCSPSLPTWQPSYIYPQYQFPQQSCPNGNCPNVRRW